MFGSSSWSGLDSTRSEMLTICRSARRGRPRHGARAARPQPGTRCALEVHAGPRQAVAAAWQRVQQALRRSGVTFGAGDRADGARAGADVHDVGRLQPRDAQVRALAYRLRQHALDPVVHDAALARVHCAAQHAGHAAGSTPLSRLPPSPATRLGPHRNKATAAGTRCLERYNTV